LIVEELNITIILLDKKFERNGVHSRELRGHIILVALMTITAVVQAASTEQ
jgi:hypothetical protein